MNCTFERVFFDRVLLGEQEIRERVDLLAKELATYTDDDGFVLVVILKGALMFAADLSRRIPSQCSIDFLTVSSYYGGTQSTGNVHIVDGHSAEVYGKKVLVVDDIFDTGLTLQTVVKFLEQKGAQEVRTCVLLKKKKVRGVPFEVDYHAFEIEDEFVVGYGLDYQGEYRKLPYVGVMKT
ncbi:hypoxanthine phosphoribosyltransferase [Rubritalea marina]|uniref:hypoxanthine phosphoribosyltransferase n=1 Tax=Rubritalea marina TaxID=361055 RepID=UPI000381BEF6|nr:hypoxanthine phosphoribosyltransferase [Rubritalea marina]